MRSVILLILVTIGSFAAKAQELVINDPNAVLRTVGEFTGIEISSSIDLYVSQSNTAAVAVSAKESKYRDNIKTDVENGILKISYSGGGVKWGNGDKKMKVYVAVKNLYSIKATGACDVFVNGTLTGDLLEIESSGASDFKGVVAVKKLKVSITGASDVSIKGTADVVEVDATGASDFKGYELMTERCTVQATGASSVKITVNKELSAKASGASDVYYKGAGVIRDIQSSGASSVVKKD